MESTELSLSIRRLQDYLAGPFSGQRLETPGGGQVFLFPKEGQFPQQGQRSAQGSPLVDPSAIRP